MLCHIISKLAKKDGEFELTHLGATLPLEGVPADSDPTLREFIRKAAEAIDGKIVKEDPLEVEWPEEDTTLFLGQVDIRPPHSALNISELVKFIADSDIVLSELLKAGLLIYSATRSRVRKAVEEKLYEFGADAEILSKFKMSFKDDTMLIHVPERALKICCKSHEQMFVTQLANTLAYSVRLSVAPSPIAKCNGSGKIEFWTTTQSGVSISK